MASQRFHIQAVKMGMMGYETLLRTALKNNSDILPLDVLPLYGPFLM